MKKQRIVLIVMMLAILLVGTASAADWDNIKNYNPETKTVVITNWLGLGNEIGEAKLLTPQNVLVGAGYQKVAEFEVKSYVDYENALKNIKFYNVKDKDEITRTYDFKYKTIEKVNVIDYKIICNKVWSEINKTEQEICSNKEVGSHEEEQEVWKELSKDLLKDQIITIGIFTNVEVGDYVEWIPTLFGVDIDEWATWTASLNVGLVSYFPLDEGSGDAVDVKGYINASLVNTPTQGATGKVGTAYDFDTNDYLLNKTAAPHLLNNEGTLALWIYPNDLSGYHAAMGAGSLAATTPYFRFGTNEDKVAFGMYNVGPTIILTYGATPPIQLNEWTFIAVTSDGTGTRFYINGTEVEPDVGVFDGTNGSWFADAGPFGTWTYAIIDRSTDYAAYDGKLDEIGIWNRTLTGAEIAQLYNGGSGMTYTTSFPLPPIVIPYAPANDSNYTTNPATVNFNCYGSDDIGFTNMTFIINNTLAYTDASGVNNTNYTYSPSLYDGTYNWSCKAFDSVSQSTQSSNRSFTIDGTKPVFTIDYPLNTTYNTNVSLFNYSLIELNKNVCWYSIDRGVTNTTLTCGNNVSGLTSTEGLNTWAIYGNDTLGNEGNDVVTFSKDTLNPGITIAFPTNTSYFYNITDLKYNYADANPGSCWYSRDGGTTNSSSVSAGTNFTSVSRSYDLNTWRLYCNDSYGNNNNTAISFTILRYNVTNETYNASTYETGLETFTVNVTHNSTIYTTITADLIFAGTSYAGTKSGTGDSVMFSKSISIPTISSAINNSFYWNFTLGTEVVSTTEHNQTANPLVFAWCDTYTTPFLNLSFKDESDGTTLNATVDSMTLNSWIGDGTYWDTTTYSNTTLNYAYTFCAVPNSTRYNNLSIQYASTGYPQRRSFLTDSLSPTLTHKTLYLLSSADGIYSVYQVQDPNGNALTGVSVSVERQISGVWDTIETGTTDSAGAVTFWLDPNNDHRITFVRTGYVTVTVVIRPSSTTYSVVMSSTSGEATYNSTLADGVVWKYGIVPMASRLTQNTTYTFWFWVNSTSSNLVAYRMELLNSTGGVLTSTIGTTATGSNLTSAINVMQNASIRGRYSINSGGGYVIVDADAFWPVGSVNMSIPDRGTIKSFFSNLNRINVFGTDEGRKQYSMALLFFILLFIVLGAISYSTGWDFATAGGALILLVPIVWIASLTGFFTITYLPPGASDLASAAFIQKYSVAIIASLLGFGYMFNKIAEGRQG
jgi:hypothetical protein